MLSFSSTSMISKEASLHFAFVQFHQAARAIHS